MPIDSPKYHAPRQKCGLNESAWCRLRPASKDVRKWRQLGATAAHMSRLIAEPAAKTMRFNDTGRPGRRPVFSILLHQHIAIMPPTLSGTGTGTGTGSAGNRNGRPITFAERVSRTVETTLEVTDPEQEIFLACCWHSLQFLSDARLRLGQCPWHS